MSSIEKLEDELKAVSERMHKVETYFKIGFVVAVIFGISGSIGAKFINDAQEKMKEVETKISNADEKTAEIEAKTDQIVEAAKEEIALIKNSSVSSIEEKAREETASAIETINSNAATSVRSVLSRSDSVTKESSNSGWKSKSPLHQKFKCPKGSVVTGIEFKHKKHQNSTHQESYLVRCSKIIIKVN